MEALMQKKSTKIANSGPAIRPSDERIEDGGKVSMGGWNPRLARVKPVSTATKDAGKVRLGGWNPKL
jgi:hypothetical protein